ncbi:MAG: effector-associated domain EAD1-containing protein [Planctomycetaceae bacterium]
MDSFVDGMAEVFQDAGTLKTFLRVKLRRNLSKCSPTDLPIDEICSNVDAKAEAQGWRRDLIAKARDEFPLRGDFRAICDDELKHLDTLNPPIRSSPLDRRRLTINFVLCSVAIVALAVWLGVGFGVVWFTTTIGAYLLTAAMSLLGRWFAMPQQFGNVGRRFVARLATGAVTRCLSAALALGGAASLFSGFIHVHSIPPEVQDVRVHRASNDAIESVVHAGDRKLTFTFPWGRTLKLEADGFRPTELRLFPWVPAECTNVEFEGRRSTSSPLQQDLKGLLPIQRQMSPKAKISIKSSGIRLCRGRLQDAVLLSTGMQRFGGKFLRMPTLPAAVSNQQQTLTIDVVDAAGATIGSQKSYTVGRAAKQWSSVKSTA